MTTTWIDTGGGPLICSAYPASSAWRGTQASSVGEARSDYDRACDVTDYVGVIRCGSAQVLVLGDEPLRTTLVSIATGLAAVRWVSCVSAGEAEVALAALPVALPQIEEPKSILIQAERLVVFDSAYALDDAPELIEAKVRPGLHKVSTERFAALGVFEFLVHRLNWVGEAES